MNTRGNIRKIIQWNYLGHQSLPYGVILIAGPTNTNLKVAAMQAVPPSPPPPHPPLAYRASSSRAGREGAGQSDRWLWWQQGYRPEINHANTSWCLPLLPAPFPPLSSRQALCLPPSSRTSPLVLATRRAVGDGWAGICEAGGGGEVVGVGWGCRSRSKEQGWAGGFGDWSIGYKWGA